VKVRCRLSTTSNSDFDSFACLGQNILQLNVSLLPSPIFSPSPYPYPSASPFPFFIGLVCLWAVCLSICVCLFPSSHFAVSVSLPCVVYFICCQHFSCRRNRFLFCTRVCVWLLFCSPVCREDISM